MPGFKRGPDGHVSMNRIADKLHVDRRVLKLLYELGRIAGLRAGGAIWLERRSLAAYLWSRPRCVRDGCNRRVIGRGPGCQLHRRDGRRRHRAVVRPRQQKSLTGDRQERLQDGHRRYRARAERVKAERGLVDVEDLVDGLDEKGRFRAGLLRKAGVPRTAAAISGHIRNGWLKPEQDLGFDKPYLFTKTSVDAYITRLRSEDEDVPMDGRLSRWNATTPEQAKSRGALYLALTGSTAEAGRVATVINKAGPKPTELGEYVEGEIRRMRASGYPLRRIENALQGDATLKHIRRVLRAGD